VAQVVECLLSKPEFKPQYCQKRKEEKKKKKNLTDMVNNLSSEEKLELGIFKVPKFS
jgi:hypothetical protein